MNYKRCKNENEKQRFLKLTNSCFGNMQKTHSDQHCMSSYIGSLDMIANNLRLNSDLDGEPAGDVQIQLSCCANRRFKSCMMSSAKQMCDEMNSSGGGSGSNFNGNNLRRSSTSSESLKKLRRTNSNSAQRIARKQLQRATHDSMEDLRTTLNEMALTGPEFICNNVNEKFCKTHFDQGHYTNHHVTSRYESILPAMIKIYANY